MHRRHIALGGVQSTANSTHPRMRFFGVRLHAVNSRRQLADAYWWLLLLPFVHDLGVYLDADVSMAAHVTASLLERVVRVAALRQIRRSLSRLTLIRALVVSKQSWTTVTRYWLKYREHCSGNCNQTSTRLHILCFQPGVQHTQRNCREDEAVDQHQHT